MKAPSHSGPQAYRLTPTQCLVIAFAMLILALPIAGCGTTVVPSHTTDSFCERIGPLPADGMGNLSGVSPSWRRWLGNTVGNYDCTCPGGSHYGKHDPICEPVDLQHRT